MVRSSYVRSTLHHMKSRHWWNGRWGRLARRDVFVGPLDGRWAVELRRGGVGGRSRTKMFGSEDDALVWIETVFLAAEEGWREIDVSSSRKVASPAAAVS